MKYFVKLFEQTADDVVDAIITQTYKDNDIKYVKWVTMHDTRVCADCAARDGKIYPITAVLQPLHWNCRCFWIPVYK